jgi:DUF1009 family protein
LRWGEVGRLLALMRSEGCREAVLIGSIRRRPDLHALRPDFATLKLLPRFLPLLGRGDNSLLTAIAAVFEGEGVRVVSPLAAAPGLAFAAGAIIGTAGREALVAAEKAAEAARTIGRLDIGQAAVAVGERVVAVEDAGGTDDLLRRVAALRQAGRIRGSGGVLVKCMKPQQDPRLDVPTVGPQTAERAREAGLDGVAAEAGRALLAGADETIAAFRREGLFLLGLKAPGRGGE